MSFVLYNRDGKTFADKHLPSLKGLFVKKEPLFTGIQMQGGTITIEGDSARFTGEHMVGGTIRIDGEVRGFMLYNREGKTWVDRHLPSLKGLFVKKEPMYTGVEMHGGTITIYGDATGPGPNMQPGKIRLE